MTDLSTLPERPAIEGAVYLPLNLIAPSTTNPRKHHADLEQERKSWNLDELAESIRKHGVIQPILVRPRAGAKPEAGEPLYELVAGERRWRASHVAEMTSIMALVRDMTDFEVLELQVIENLQREGLHPMEEAESYERLLRKDDGLQGYANVDELAARLGKSRRYVYNRLSLCRLCPEAREAFYDGKLSTSVAQLVASLPHAEQQAGAVQRIATGWGGEPLTFRATSEYLQREFMLQLDKARFDIQAVYTVAGPCGQCPKRSGANPDLFADITSGDMCQDAACFQAKVHEHRQRQIDEAEAAGCTVIDGDQARKLLPYPGSSPAGYHELDKPCTVHTDSKKPLRDLLGAEHPLVKSAVVIDREGRDDLLAVAPDAAVKKALKSKGLLREMVPAKNVTGPNGKPVMVPATAVATPKPMTEQQIKSAVHHRSAVLFGVEAFKRMHQVISTDEQLPIIALRMTVRERIDEYLSAEAAHLLYAARDWVLPDREHGISSDLEQRVDRASARELADLLVELLIVEQCTDNVALEHITTGHPLRVLAKEYGVDLADLQKQANKTAAIDVANDQREREEAIEKAKTAAKEKQTADRAEAKKKAAAKHRTPDATEAFVAAHDQDAVAQTTAPYKVGDRITARKRTGLKGSAPMTGVVTRLFGGSVEGLADDGGKFGGFIESFELADKPPTKSRKGDDAPIPVKAGPVISPAAAWPFPTGANAA